jgi:hypothetical protein
MAIGIGSGIILAAIGLLGAGTAGVVVLRSSGPFADSEPPAAQQAQDPIEVARVSTVGNARLQDGAQAQAVAELPSGDLVVADYYAREVYVLKTSGDLELLAGSGEPLAIDGQGPNASFAGPVAVAVGKAGEIYVADDLAHRIRRVDPDGTVWTLAGGGPEGLGAGGYKDGKGDEARFNLPVGVRITIEFGESSRMALWKRSLAAVPWAEETPRV